MFGGRARKRRHAYSGLERTLKSASMYVPVDIYVARATLTSLIAGALMAAIAAALSVAFAAEINYAVAGAISRSGFGNIGSSPMTLRVVPSLPHGNSMAMAFILTPLAFIATFFACRAIYFYYPACRASSREHDINNTFPHAVTFLYAMCNGGMTPLESFRSLGEHREVYGEMAGEAKAIVRGVDLLGYDLLTSIKSVAATTPSEQLKGFLESMVSVMEGGGDLSRFLYSRVDQCRELARREQKTLLDLLGLMAESYVTAMVAGPLFIIIIMVSIGMMYPANDTIMQMVVYLLVPFGTLIFIALLYLLGLIEAPDSRVTTARELKAFSDVKAIPEPGERRIRISAWRYGLRKALENPPGWLIRSPEKAFYVSVPFALLMMAWLFYTHSDIYGMVRGTEGLLVFGFLAVAAPFAIVWEARRRKVHDIDAQIPEFLKRLASMNEAGLTLDKAIKALLSSNLGVLNSEIRKMARDLEWGAGVRDALIRFEQRINTLSIRRAVTLIVNASYSSNSIKDTLTIAAGDAEASNTMRAERSADMLIYVSIIYISFVVFLYIAFVLVTTFLPAVPASAASATPSSLAGVIPQATAGQTEHIKSLLFHAVLIQGLFSGIIAGVMGEGSLQSGLKHSIVMVLAAYVAFTLFM
jgi:flagellar protein FlaJ